MPAANARRLSADELERQRFCSIAEAATYLGRSYAAVYELLREQRIESVYQGPQRRMVVVKSLKKYADALPIDKPEVGVR
jgi:excisionase family DNA binding protein